jgi:archaeosortase A (PGF-CTERM-specific)
MADVTVLGSVLDGLAALGQLSDPLAWLVVAGFLAGAVVDRYDRELARWVTVGTWVAFGVFWLSTFHHFAFVQKSAIEGVGVALAVPASLSAALLLARGRDSLFVLSRSMAVMGLVYLPVQAIGPVRQALTETVAAQVAILVDALGYDPLLVDGLTFEDKRIAAKEYPYLSTFVFRGPEGEPLTYTVKLACTGLGSIAVFAGLIAAVRAPLRRKAWALGVSVAVIYALNLLRNVFIAIGFGAQQFQVAPRLVGALFAVEEEVMVSYYVADRVIAQSASVLALVGITWLVVGRLPELLAVVEDAVYVLTRREYDLRGLVGPAPEVRADGEG